MRTTNGGCEFSLGGCVRLFDLEDLSKRDLSSNITRWISQAQAKLSREDTESQSKFGIGESVLQATQETFMHIVAEDQCDLDSLPTEQQKILRTSLVDTLIPLIHESDRIHPYIKQSLRVNTYCIVKGRGPKFGVDNVDKAKSKEAIRTILKVAKEEGLTVKAV